ncbi:nucleotide-binding universal stress UspA family protein [Streptomyces sp. B4I13]|nr:nucleotide-binding universal stress UspA family protein [Streptomyces sp. B4I13]
MWLRWAPRGPAWNPHRVRAPEQSCRGTVERRSHEPCDARGGAGRAKEDTMSHPVPAGIDGSEHGSAAADWAAREAALRGVPLRLFHAFPRLPGPATVPGPALDRLRHMGAQMLERVVADLGDRYPDVEVRGEQADDAPAAALLVAARAAGLLVVGTRGTGGFDGLAVGSVALRMAAAAPCPVVLVPQRPGALGAGVHAARGAVRVVVGFDAHRPVGEVADFAFSAAAARGARSALERVRGCGPARRGPPHRSPGGRRPTGSGHACRTAPRPLPGGGRTARRITAAQRPGGGSAGPAAIG